MKIHPQTAARLAQAVQHVWPTCWPAVFRDETLTLTFTHADFVCQIVLEIDKVKLFWGEEQLDERLFDSTFGSWVPVRDAVLDFLATLREADGRANVGPDVEDAREHLNWIGSFSVTQPVEGNRP
jgi:hypothetical protein